jgi:DNA-binding transcriptional ArsR family regulator
MPGAADAENRKASLREARALAHPLRLRILRLCTGQALTNKELADQLGEDPGTTLHHVRILVDTGFLEPQEVRHGVRGALERPYLATGRSWTLDVSQTPERESIATAAFDALRQELADPGQDIHYYARVGLRLGVEAREELAARLEELANEFEARQEGGSERIGVFFIVHGPRAPEGDGRSPRRRSARKD